MEDQFWQDLFDMLDLSRPEILKRCSDILLLAFAGQGEVLASRVGRIDILAVRILHIHIV